VKIPVPQQETRLLDARGGRAYPGTTLAKPAAGVDQAAD